VSVVMSAVPDLSARRDHGVAWMNRGHALMLDGQTAGAVAAYAQAIATLRQLPVGENPSWANSLGAALMNHGQLLHRLHGTARATEALVSFDEAAAILRPLVPTIENPATPWPRRNLTGTLLNRANLLLDLARCPEAATTARAALTLATAHKRSDAIDADLALKTRRALCDALGQLLVAPGADQDALATEASDLTDDALALIRHWTGRGEISFQPLALRFFHYGTQLYRLHQPHFLAEFIRENLPLNADFQAIALDAIDSALAERPRDQKFLTIGDPVSERQRMTWRELADLRTHLAA